MLENLGTWIVKCNIRWRNTNLYLSRCKVQIQSGQNSGPVVFCRVMQSDGQRAAPLRSVTCWHLCILCHLLFMHISYNISHHTTLGILRHPCYVLYLCILRNLIRYTYCPPLRKLRNLYVCPYADMCCTFSGGWIDLFVCFCVFVEMHMFLYVYKIAHSLVVWLIWLFACVCLLLSF